MRGRWGWEWGLVIPLLGGCQPNAAGMGSGGANTLGDDDAADRGDDSLSESAEEGTRGSGGGGDGEGVTTSTDPGVGSSGSLDDTAEPGTSSTTGDPPPTTDGGMSLLTISDGPTYDFGVLATGAQTSHVFTVTNEGDAEATGLDGSVAAPFALQGGFPGGGTCGGSLAAGTSCTVGVTFAPVILGLHAATLTVGHVEGPAATRDVVGDGTGQSDNLLANPGGESAGEPAPSWSDVGPGVWGAGVWPMETGAFAGGGYLYADEGPDNQDYVLRQDVSVAHWAAVIDGGAMRFSMQGHARALTAGNDQHRISVYYLDGGGDTLASWSTGNQSASGWQVYGDERAAPSSTRTVRVELGCRKSTGELCHAYYDALDLHALHP
jgi:hypothetical protein